MMNIALMLGLSLVINCCASPDIIDRLKTADDVVTVFPKTAQEVAQFLDEAKQKADQLIADVLAVPDDQRTFANTVAKIDRLGWRSSADINVFRWIFLTLERLSPDDNLRAAASKAIVEIDIYAVEKINNNIELYRALIAYARGNGTRESLSEEQSYFLQITIDAYKRNGMDLPESERAHVSRLNKEIAQLCSEFEKNIADDNRTIAVSIDELSGLNQEFIDSLPRNEQGDYLLGIDLPTLMKILTNCSCQDTRKRLHVAACNRAFPQNEIVLKQMIAKRDELAHRLGFASFNDLNLEESTIRNNAAAQAFIDEIVDRTNPKDQQEFERFTKRLPDGVTFTRDAKLPLWDSFYAKASYKKQHLSIDEDKLAEYFPMEKTIDGLLDIYRQFLSIEFVRKPISGFWHEDVVFIEVYDKEKQKLHGFLLMDLHPRANKYNHACHISMIPRIKSSDNNDRPGLSCIICNYPKSTPTKPALMQRNFVRTFFHEFGHALHNLLSRTQCDSFAGSRVFRDFGETPSQMLEEWLSDRDILKNLSCHYITGEQLPDELIDSVLELKNFESGYYWLRQAYLAHLSLEFYKEGADKDVTTIERELFNKFFKNLYRTPEYRTYAAFNHLTDYGPQYYGYVLAEVFALDLFSEIKKHGLLNPEIGQKYLKEILMPGGSKNPYKLLENFLGRPSNADAFFKDLGL